MTSDFILNEVKEKHKQKRKRKQVSQQEKQDSKNKLKKQWKMSFFDFDNITQHSLVIIGSIH